MACLCCRESANYRRYSHHGEQRMSTKKTDNPGSGFVGVAAIEPEDETGHFYVCAACGQAVDMRDLGQVFHHEEDGHKPLVVS